MYQVYLDGAPIHDPLLEIALGEPVLTLTDNKTGAFDFQIYPGNPGYERLNKLRSVIQVFRDEEELFRGRMIEEEKDFDGVKRIACEGEMSFLLDSIQRPKIYPQQSLTNYLKALLDNHNSQAGAAKKIELGNVTVRDPAGNVDRTINWEPTLTCLNGLLDSLGGHFCIRYAGEKRYLDYLAGYDRLTAQVIEFGENLLDYSETTTAGDIATCIIPLGKKLDQKDDTDKKLDRYITIESVNAGKDYLLNEEAAEQFGVIARTIKFDEITAPADLKSAGTNYLNQLQFENLTLSVKAIDLNLMHVDIAPIRMGDNIRVCSQPHGMDRVFPVLQRTYHLTDPTEDTITLGDTLPKTFNDTVSSVTQDTTQAIREQNKATEYFADAAQLFSAMAASSLGCYETSKNENGSVTHYWHDQPRLEESRYIRMSNANGYFFSADGGKEGSWRGIDQNANALLETLTAKHITADKITGGRLESHNLKTWVDMENGRFNFADKFTLDEYGNAALKCDKMETLNAEYRFIMRDNQAVLPSLIEGWNKQDVEWDPNSPLYTLKGQALDFMRGNTIIGSICFTDIWTNGVNMPILNLYSKWYIFEVPGYQNTSINQYGVNSAGYNVSSTEEIKDNISAAGSVLPLMDRGKVYCYNLKQEGESNKTRSKQTKPNKYGFVIGREVPEELISEDRKHIDLYNTVSILWKAVQELKDEVSSLKA